MAGQLVRLGCEYDDPEAEPWSLVDEGENCWGGLCDETFGAAEPWPGCGGLEGSGDCTPPAAEGAGEGGGTAAAAAGRGDPCLARCVGKKKSYGFCSFFRAEGR